MGLEAAEAAAANSMAGIIRVLFLLAPSALCDDVGHSLPS
jgi:hypothetical protein